MKTTATMTVARKRPCRRHCIELLSFCSADEQLLQVISERKRESERKQQQQQQERSAPVGQVCNSLNLRPKQTTQVALNECEIVANFLSTGRLHVHHCCCCCCCCAILSHLEALVFEWTTTTTKTIATATAAEGKICAILTHSGRQAEHKMGPKHKWRPKFN